MTTNIQKEMEQITTFFSNLVRRTQVIEKFLYAGSMFAAFVATVNLFFHNLMIVAVSIAISLFCVISQYGLNFIFHYYGNKSLEKLNALVEKVKNE